MAATATTTIVTLTRDAVREAAQKPRRIFELDATKGILVLTMVLYHWMNYFVAVDPSVYRYLRFLTPSFIFITGFLISYVYLRRSIASSRNIPARLLVRGLKLLAIVLVLNIVPALLAARGFQSRAGDTTIRDLILGCFLGTKAIAFSVLVPIAYLLIASGALLRIFQRYPMTFHVLSAITLSCALTLASIGIDSSYLQLFSIGALGISIGHFPIDRLNRAVKHKILLLTAYAAYLWAITVWNATYPLQIVGVCLSVALIYAFAGWCGESNYAGRTAIALGQYSLFGYIIQIVILQILHKALRFEPDSDGLIGLAFVVCIVGTITSVKIVNWSRLKYRSVNTIYSAIFG